MTWVTPVNSGWEEGDQKSAKSIQTEGMVVHFLQTKVCRAVPQASVRMPRWELGVLIPSLRIILSALTSFFNPLNDAVLQGMTMHSTKPALAPSGTTTQATGLTSTGEITSILNFTTFHWRKGSGWRSRRRRSTSGERAPKEAHLQSKKTVSSTEEVCDNTDGYSTQTHCLCFI